MSNFDNVQGRRLSRKMRRRSARRSATPRVLRVESLEARTLLALVADSVAGFAGVQGANGWEYGMAFPTIDGASPVPADFTPMGRFTGTVWQPTNSQPDPALGAEYNHPGWSGSYDGAWPVRRYTSEVTGLVNLSGQIQHTQTGGDGTYARLLLNGGHLYAQATAASSSEVIYDYSLTTQVMAGETLELAVDDRGNSAYDGTRFTLQVNTITDRRVVADTFRDFGTTQGHADASATGTWQYGHYATVNTPTTFTTEGWTYHEGVRRWKGPDGEYHELLAGGGHPGSMQEAVRRWTSGVSGPIQLDGVLRRTDEDMRQNLDNSDGIVGRIYYNGTLIFTGSLSVFKNLNGTNDLINGDANSFRLARTVAVGDTIDFVVNPDGPGAGNSDYFDGFGFCGTISVDNPDITPPAVVSFSPVGFENQNVDRMAVQFSEPMQAATFTGQDVVITGPGGTVAPAQITVRSTSPTQFEIALPMQSAEGLYNVEIGPDIRDLAGNGMGGTGGGFAPVAGTGASTPVPNGSFETGILASWTMLEPQLGMASVDPNHAFAGSYGVRLDTSRDFSGTGYAIRTQPIAVTPNQQYVLSGFFDASALSTGRLYIDLNDVAWHDGGDVEADAVRGKAGWQIAWKEFTVPASVTSVVVRLVRDSQAKPSEPAYADVLAVTLAS